jgi:hypothetical protein
MSALDHVILRNVERKMDKEDLEPAKVDILVCEGHVTFTGNLVYRNNHHPMSEAELYKFKREILRIAGVSEITFHFLHNTLV